MARATKSRRRSARWNCATLARNRRTLPRNGGASNARNVGAALATSSWIAFLDSDDVWVPGATRALLAAGDDADIVCGHFRRVEGDGTPGAPECG